MGKSSSFVSLSLLLLVLLDSSFAQYSIGQYRSGPYSIARRGQAGCQLGQQQQYCKFERISAQEPQRRVNSEAGYTEYFDQYNEQLQCVGVAAHRRTIEPRGLLVPQYHNAPSLVYIIQGQGLIGLVLPGCPETYQSFHPQFEQQEQMAQFPKFREEHQKVQRFRQGDVVAIPAGVAHWCYNDGDSPIITVQVFDTSNQANQLEQRHRDFLLASRHQSAQQATAAPQSQEQQQQAKNVLSGFNTDLLAEAMGIDRELARKIQCQEDRRGEIVRVQAGLQYLRPQFAQPEQQQPQYYPPCAQEAAQSKPGCAYASNGLEQTLCAMKNRDNIEEASRADFFNPRAGKLTTLNSQKLPILSLIQMSAERGTLYQNAFRAPYWNVNAHSVMYVIRGVARMQVVDHRGNAVFDGEVRQGQLIVLPQNYVVVKRSHCNQFDWIEFKTNDNAIVNQLAGKASAFKGIPEEVLLHSYRITREEAKRLKFNRGEESILFNPTRYLQTVVA